ncbi:MAG: TIGR03621 family F420-dependent LLM class oxidoreductase [Acidimicrobiia bacterium]|nr:TIGR03621 family F420-dependent LLM class oxidoreductase [Acidimicrobiia bacterium]
MPTPFRFGAQVADARSGAAWGDVARKVEDGGYSTLFMPDHFDDQAAPLPALTWAAAATSELRVGSLVLDNDYRHPVVLAKEAATLDLLSDGRLELGIGAGWLHTDYQMSGIPFEPAGARIERLQEGVAVIKGLMSGEPFSYEGAHYTISEMTGTPKPAQQPHPPILIGAGATRMLSFAAREADIISVNFDLSPGAVNADVVSTGTAELTSAKIDLIREVAGDRFDQIELSVTVFFAAIHENREQLAEAVAGSFGQPPEMVLESPHFCAGTEEQIAEQLQERRERFGFSYVVFGGGSYEAMLPVVAKLAGT